MFREVLARTGCDLPGCRGAAIVGLDGMVIEQWTSTSADRNFSMEPAAAEVTSVIRSARAALVSTSSARSGGSPLTELTLRTADWSGVARAIGRDYFLIVLTLPDTALGRTRFVVERALPLLERELA